MGPDAPRGVPRRARRCACGFRCDPTCWMLWRSTCDLPISVSLRSVHPLFDLGRDLSTRVRTGRTPFSRPRGEGWPEAWRHKRVLWYGRHATLLLLSGYCNPVAHDGGHMPHKVTPRRTISIAWGNAVQLGGLLGAPTLAWYAGRQGVRGTGWMVASRLLAYFSEHAFSHWLVGRAVGIRFTGYALHGTSHPQSYPPRSRLPSPGRAPRCTPPAPSQPSPRAWRSRAIAGGVACAERGASSWARTYGAFRCQDVIGGTHGATGGEVPVLLRSWS